MRKQKIIIGFLLCLSVVIFARQSLSQTPSSSETVSLRDDEISNKMTPAERQKEFEQRIKQRQIEREKRRIERMRQKEQTREERKRDRVKRKEQSMKEALGATDEQWKAIKPRLEKVQYLARQMDISISIFSQTAASGSGSIENSGRREVGSLYGRNRSSNRNIRKAPLKPNNVEKSSRSQFSWKWYKPWEKKARDELTENEKIREELFVLLQKKNPRPEELEQKMEALRKIRRELKKELAHAQQELREILTHRQEAILIMMRLLN
jgi:flagellar motor switch/type III secretory pathway protein FliN